MRAPRSLRLRLLAGAGLAILLALAVSGAGIIWLFQRHIERREAVSLEAKGRELIAGLSLSADGRPLVDRLPSDNRYTRPASGLYWQVSTPRGALHSASLWDQALPRPTAAPADWTLRQAQGAFGGQILILERSILPDASHRPVLVQLATDAGALREARREFARETILSLALLWVVLVLAAYGQVTLGLRPLRHLRQELDQLRRNPAARISDRHPQEVAPLVAAINALADARTEDVARARRRASDLAHSLKTPLAALSAQSRRAREAGASDAADGLDRAIAAAAASLEAELARARAGFARTARGSARADIATVAESVVAVIERTERGEALVFDIDVATGTSAPLSADGLVELLGALIENAARFARRQIWVSGERNQNGIMLVVSDDGPGITDEQIATALVLGQRLDEGGPGHGFGLAIVRDLVEATGGQLSLGAADAGGLAVRIVWPDDGSEP